MGCARMHTSAHRPFLHMLQLAWAGGCVGQTPSVSLSSRRVAGPSGEVLRRGQWARGSMVSTQKCTLRRDPAKHKGHQHLSWTQVTADVQKGPG